MNQGMLFIVSAPSGAGKTSLVAALIKKLGDVAVSVSWTDSITTSLMKANFSAVLMKVIFSNMLGYSTIYTALPGRPSKISWHRARTLSLKSTGKVPSKFES